MQIQIHFGDGIEKSDALTDHATQHIEHALRHVKTYFTRVELHLHNDNANKSGADDKRCVIELRPANFDPIAVEDSADDFYKAVTLAAKRLARAAEHFVDRHRKH